MRRAGTPCGTSSGEVLSGDGQNEGPRRAGVRRQALSSNRGLAGLRGSLVHGVVSPQIHMLKRWPPAPQNETVFGDGVFKNTIEGALIRCDQCPCMKERLGTQRDGRVRTHGGSRL